ncbi:unnamed protein product, partial [Chrysoparadoxa australica]
LSCRFCEAPLSRVVVDLGVSPIANDLIDLEKAHEAEPKYPLKIFVCEECNLVQLQGLPNIFRDDYVYYSSVSDTTVESARLYVNKMRKMLELGADSLVVEVASNDGYLLQHMLPLGIPAMGVEPCADVAQVAKSRGIPTMVEFFGEDMAQKIVGEKRRRADLLLANHVLAHVPDLNDFIRGMKVLLAEDGVLTVEFQHLMNLIEQTQFDTLYHEHMSYFTLLALIKIFAHHGLQVFDVSELPVHGGSLRVFAKHQGLEAFPVTSNVEKVLSQERSCGLDGFQAYAPFYQRVLNCKESLLNFLKAAKERGQTVVGYGAPAKGNTLLNYCGINSDLLQYTVDRAPSKQNKLLPGTRIPVCLPSRIMETKPDYILILPWNIKDEIMRKMAGVKEWGCQFVVPIPEVTIY